MSRSRRAWLSALLAGAVILSPGAAVAAAQPDEAPVEDLALPAEDLVLPVEDLIAEVESMDGTQSESKQGKTVTVAITSDVLFKLDKANLTAKARKRLEQVAEKIKAESAGGPVRVEGHTDDQGSDSYNDGLSLRRAQAVQEALEGLIPGGSFQAKGFGEKNPKYPNIVDGEPVEKNRARNRRVEIIFDAKQ